jgi:hypothetical protein
MRAFCDTMHCLTFTQSFRVLICFLSPGQMSGSVGGAWRVAYEEPPAVGCGSTAFPTGGTISCPLEVTGRPLLGRHADGAAAGGRSGGR